MQRIDLYTPAHKAVRALLFDALAVVGCTDFARREELAAARGALRRALRLMRRRDELEELVLHPLLVRLTPALAAELAAGHRRSAGLARAIEGDLARLARAAAAERVSLGRRLQRRLGLLAAAHLAHQALEESRASRALEAHLADEHRAALEARLLVALEPAECAEWLAWLLPACHPGERARILAILRAALPAAQLEARTRAARDWLGAARWDEALELAEGCERPAREVAAS